MVDEDKLQPLPFKEEWRRKRKWRRRSEVRRQEEGKQFSGESHHPIHSGKTAVQYNRRRVNK